MCVCVCGLIRPDTSESAISTLKTHTLTQIYRKKDEIKLIARACALDYTRLYTDMKHTGLLGYDPLRKTVFSAT